MVLHALGVLAGVCLLGCGRGGVVEGGGEGDDSGAEMGSGPSA
jgi:hypothetical protein